MESYLNERCNDWDLYNMAEAIAAKKAKGIRPSQKELDELDSEFKRMMSSTRLYLKEKKQIQFPILIDEKF